MQITISYTQKQKSDKSVEYMPVFIVAFLKNYNYSYPIKATDIQLISRYCTAFGNIYMAAWLDMCEWVYMSAS